MPNESIVLWNAADAARWTSAAADGSSARVSGDAGALRFDYDLVGPTSWTIARLETTFELPAHYVVVARVRGDGAANQFQLKFVDPSGANVWWWRLADFAPPHDAATLKLRRAALEFAWGPASGGEPSKVAAIELAMAAGPGGSGSLWIEELRIEARSPSSARPAIVAVRASSHAPGREASLVMPTRAPDGHADGATIAASPATVPAADQDPADRCWRPATGDAGPWIEVDLGASCEWGGLVVDFADGADVPASRLLASDDGVAWTCVATGEAGDAGGGSRRWLRTRDGEGRFARVEFAPPPGAVSAGASTVAVRRVGVVPLEQALSPSRWMGSVARTARRGLFPRHLVGEQEYWAVVSADGDACKGLLGEDGALELGAERGSLEPFLWVDGRLVTWADVDARVELADGHLPVPTVEWSVAGLVLRVTAFACGDAGSSTLVARYEVRDASGRARRVRLFVALRPFQVNPSWQSLNLVGGVAPVAGLARDGDRVLVGGGPTVHAVTRPDAFGAAASEDGLGALLQGLTPPRERVDDPVGFAEGAFAWDLDLQAGGAGVVAVAVPLHDASPGPPSGLPAADAAAWADARLAETLAHWRSRLAVVPVQLPPCAGAFADTLKASIAWVLANRDGPRIQPGPRCYRRSWIRDGTLTGTALAEMGFAREAVDFLRWFAPYQLDDGRVPCAVDHHGIDPVAEHDSHGQLVWGVCELSRLTGDRAFLEEMWPRVRRAADAIADLRATRTTAAYEGRACYGLMPESISHEGYSSRPVHAFWDDFFAVRGLADAAWAAAELGDAGAASRFAGLRDAMRADLHAAIARTIADHGIDFVPGAVELGDFDPTSTAIALDPGGEGARLPQDALRRTFERYWQEFDDRRSGRRAAEAWTAYEVRNAPALVLLGERRRAIELLEWLLGDQRPPAWRQWPEVSTRDRRAPRFLGDLPHGWIASSFVRAVRRMVAYEVADDGSLVLGAGLPEAWVRDPAGVRATGLPTHAGRLDLHMVADGPSRVRVTIGGDLRWPAAGVVVESPLEAPLRRVLVDGIAREPDGPHRVVLAAPAGEVILEAAGGSPAA